MVQRLNNRQILWNFILIFALSFAIQGHAQSLALENFLDQVRAGNQDYLAHAKASQGAELRSNEASFITGPMLFGEVRYGEDREEPNIPTQPNDNRATEFSFGVKQQFSFGVNAELSYERGKYDLRGANPGLLPANMAQFYRSRPELKVSVPLMKNLFGKEVRAQRDAQFNKGKVVQYTESFQAKRLLAEAESVYWKLALSRSLVKSSKENLERAQKMSSWTTRRKNLGLADESSFLQADANFELRQLEYQNALDEERASRRRFNSLRGVASDRVDEVLAQPSASTLDEVKVPAAFTEREDLKAQRAALKAKKAAGILDAQKFKPSLDVFGLYALNGKDAELNQARSESLSTGRDTYAVGLRFTMPLDAFTLAKQQRGYALEERAAELQLERKEFESVRDWEDITQRFVEGRNRFKVMLKIEEALRKRLTREKDLQGRGRSTLFQVLQFEGDYATSQVARTRAQVELLSLYAILKTYPESNSKE